MGLDVTRWSAPVEWLSGVGGMGRNTGMSARRRTKNSSGSGFAALLVLGAIAWVIMFIIRHIWVILGILVVVGSIYVAKAIVEDNRRRRDAYARYCADIATKADQQDNWVAAGDERGIYGPGAVDLMRYIRSGGKTPPPTMSTPRVVVPEPLSPARQAAAPAVVASGVGVALLLAQIPGPGSEQNPSPTPPTRTSTPLPTSRPPGDKPSPLPSFTSTPSLTETVEPAPTYLPPTTETAPPTTDLSPSSTYMVPPPTAEPSPAYQPAPEATYYRNCSQAHADGRYNIPRGDPAYRPGLDRDHDGLACE